MIFDTGIDGEIVNLELDTSIEHGILLSGGLDSAILLSLMIKVFLAAGEPVKICPFTVDGPGSEFFAKMVIKYVNTRYDINIPDPIIVGDANAHHSQKTTSAMREIVRRFGDRIELVWQATNQNPPKEDFDYGRFYDQNSYPNRVKGEVFYRNKLPFIHLRKNHIVNMIDLHDLGDIETVTHSCTQMKKFRCTSCFQCLERSWAFKKNNKKDKGIY